ncbi:MarR family winged helix-turn-helix transcriptional regulator [Aquihabitans sp. McL0605]|uniref:MarR family winged helix-turn-helix transcriptional regulator n=1 Tax=Aquihabitans sp. McL0605 TaxID=3415671 RepID=UPI003CF53F65
MTREPAPPLIGALVRRPAEAVHLRILREAHEAGFTDLVPAHLAVLRYPGPDGRRPSDLAADVGTTKQAMNYLLGQLERAGYIYRSDDPDDQRSKRVQLTERGEGLRRIIRRTVTQIEKELEVELGTASYSQLRELLVRLNDTDTIKAERDVS